MKRVFTCIKCILMFALITTGVIAQTPTTQQEPKRLSDQTMSSRLQTDLNKRNSATLNQTINWWDAGYGYYGTYTLDDNDYMIRYDRQGNYLETLQKKEWNSTVTSPVTSAFNQSAYKNQQVLSYWEVSDPNRKGYYLELNDKGNTQRIWMNDQYKFSTTPYTIPTGSSQKPNN